jgi:hypothetical protein
VQHDLQIESGVNSSVWKHSRISNQSCQASAEMRLVKTSGRIAFPDRCGRWGLRRVKWDELSQGSLCQGSRGERLMKRFFFGLQIGPAATVSIIA